MVQKLSIDPNIVNSKILKASLKKIDQGFQNLIEIKKMENPTIYLNSKIKDQIIKNISQLKIILNDKITESEEYKRLSSQSLRVEILMTELLNSPNLIYKFREKAFDQKEFTKYIFNLYEKFGSSFLDYILVEKIMKSGFKEIDGYLSDYLEKNINQKRKYYLSNDIKNFEDFKIIILEKLGFKKNVKNQKLYLINPGILRIINNYSNFENESNKRSFLDLCSTIKCVCYYYLDNIEIYENRPQIIIATDNPGKKLDESLLRNIFIKEFNEFNDQIDIHLVVIEKWRKKSKDEQRYIFSSNEIGFASNIDLNFLRKTKWGTNYEQYRSIQENYSQFRVANDGIFTEIVTPDYKNFVYDDLIGEIDALLNIFKSQLVKENEPKNPAFLYALENKFK